jgi:nucleobase:cation symporter-1, NCS1 family
VRISDWARFAKTRNAVVLPLLLAQPITVTLGALVGVLVTSSVNHLYGELIWNP